MGLPPLIQAASPNRSTAAVLQVAPVAKPRANSLSKKAHRNVRPKPMRSRASARRAKVVGVVLSVTGAAVNVSACPV